MSSKEEVRTDRTESRFAIKTSTLPQFGRQLGLPLKHNTRESDRLAMFPIPSSAGWLAAAALATASVYFIVRITSKRRFYRDHDIVCTYLPTYQSCLGAVANDTR
jgi:hypothetical protein